MALSIQGQSGTEVRLLNDLQQNFRRRAISEERLATAKRINHAEDDPAGLVGAEQLRGEIADLTANIRAAEQQRHRARILDSANSQSQTVLRTLQGLVTSAAGASSEAERLATQQQIDDTLDAVASIGSRSSGLTSAELASLRSGGSSNVVDGDVFAAAETLNSAISALSQKRAAAGAKERYNYDARLELYGNQIVQLSEALSLIEDTDFAAEIANLAQADVLIKAALSAMAFDSSQRAAIAEILLEALDDVEPVELDGDGS